MNFITIATRFLRSRVRFMVAAVAVHLLAADPSSAPAASATWRESWTAQHFSPALYFDDLADPDGDGLVNLVEYAFALPPVQWNPPGSGVTVGAVFDGIHKIVTMTFRRDPRATDLSYSLETSSNLSDWNKVVESRGGEVPFGSAFVSEADAPGEAPVKVVTATELLPPGAERFVRVRITTPSTPPPTLIFEQIGGVGTSTTVSGVPLDLTANRYIIEVDGATWSDTTDYSGVIFGSANGAATFIIRPEGGKMLMYEGDNNNAANFSNTGRGATDLWAPVNNTAYRIGIECGLGQAHVIVDSVPITQKSSAPVNAVCIYQRLATTAPRPDPANLVRLSISPGVRANALRIYRREMANINNLVLLGDSITAAQDWEYRMRVDLGPGWMINNQGVGYRQSREMKAALLTPFPGDSHNVANYYADVAGLYRSGAASNWVLIGIGTNDIVYYNHPVLSSGPESGGYTAAATIGYILGAIADIRANNPGWKVAVRTILNCNGISGGGSYATAETMRQVINASILSGSIAAAADKVIDQDNVFAPAASRTDGTGVNGVLYNSNDWPAYSNSPVNFDWFHVHPTPSCYQALADYIAVRFR